MDDLTRIYAELADEELVALAAETESLTEAARNALWDELHRRGLSQEASRVHQEQLGEAEPSSQPPPQLVTIAVFHDPVKAHLARAQLESEGVECFLADEHMARVYSLASFAFGGIKLRVREADVERAATILGAESGISKRSGTWASPRAKTLVWVLILWSLAVAVIVLLFQLFGYFE